MDWKAIPSLNSLRAFHAVAQTGGYSPAATLLNVTHPAISQHVKSLESHLGVSLVVRSGRGISLTDEGKRLSRDLDSAFSLIQRSVGQIVSEAEAQPVQVTMSPAFAVEWLMPRLGEFQPNNPDITLLLNPTSQLIEPSPSGPDVAIRYRDRRRPTPELPTVLVSDMVVVGTPELVATYKTDEVEDLLDLPWLQELGTNEVADWFRYRGIVPERKLNISQMPGNLIMNAVRRGDGITYTARAFFEDDIAAGRMVVLFSEPLFGLYYVQTLSAPLRPAVKKFVDWLLSNAVELGA
jgi:LysR family glycine cleavage system transcriptional activator